MSETKKSLQESIATWAFFKDLCWNIHKELSVYMSWEPGWDGYAAPKFDPDVLEESYLEATSLLSEWAKYPKPIMPTSVDVGPSSDGSVFIEFGFTSPEEPNYYILTTEKVEGEIVTKHRWTYSPAT